MLLSFFVQEECIIALDEALWHKCKAHFPAFKFLILTEEAHLCLLTLLHIFYIDMITIDFQMLRGALLFT